MIEKLTAVSIAGGTGDGRLTGPPHFKMTVSTPTVKAN